jgi:hypothetical protein
MVGNSIKAGLVSIAVTLSSAIAQTLSPNPVFEGNMTTPAKDGAALPVHVSIQSWQIANQKDGAVREIPLQGFYVAHLLSGNVVTRIDGQTTKQAPGDYWVVKTGASMQIEVVGEFAVLETIVAAKQ